MSNDKPLHENSVVINYTDYNGVTRDRVVVPYEIKVVINKDGHGRRWMLEAFDVARGDYRTFAMSGIHSWRLATEEDNKS